MIQSSPCSWNRGTRQCKNMVICFQSKIIEGPEEIVCHADSATYLFNTYTHTHLQFEAFCPAAAHKHTAGQFPVSTQDCTTALAKSTNALRPDSQKSTTGCRENSTNAGLRGWKVSHYWRVFSNEAEVEDYIYTVVKAIILGNFGLVGNQL